MNNQFNEEIDLIGGLKKLYKSKKILIYSSIAFVIIGVFIALLSPVKFESSTVFIPQNQEASSSSLSGVASLVGINLSSSSYGGDVPPSMYPQIGASPKFKRQLLNTIVDKKENITLKRFLVEHYKIKEDNKSSYSSELEMTELEEACFRILDEIISINVNQKDGFVTINSIMPIAEYSAITAKNSREILQNIIIKNKIERAQQNLNFS